MVHICSCVGNIVSRLFIKYRDPVKKREVISACCAIGISVAFGAPIGGVLFSLEECSSYFPPKTLWRSLFGAVIGAITLQMINPGGLDLLRVTYDQSYHWFEVAGFVFLGILGGALGALFIALGSRWTAYKRKSSIRSHPIAEVAVVVVITALITYQNYFMGFVEHSMIALRINKRVKITGIYIRQYRLSARSLLSLMFSECGSSLKMKKEICSWDPWALGSLLLAALLKCVLAVFTFALDVPAGLFLPSLGIGSIFGHLVGSLFRVIQM